MEDFFTGWFHKKLAALFIRLANLEPHKQAGLLTVEEIDRLTCVIKEFTTEITAANPFENAQICCGEQMSVKLLLNQWSRNLRKACI